MRAPIIYIKLVILGIVVRCSKVTDHAQKVNKIYIYLSIFKLVIFSVVLRLLIVPSNLDLAKIYNIILNSRFNNLNRPD